MGFSSGFSIEGRPWRDASEIPSADNQSISPAYFRVVGIPLLDGRELSDADTADSPLVAVISRSIAQRYWPKGDSIGHRIKMGAIDAKNPWMTIVGVVADMKQNWARTRPDYAIYRTYRQIPRNFSAVLIRTSGDPMNLAGAARSAIAAVDTEEPAYDVKSMEKAVRDSMMGIAYVSVMMGIMAVMALVLAAVGVYGVMAFAVSQRTYEIGVRMALGAQRRDVLRLVIGGGLLLTAIGIAIGLPLSIASGRLLGSVVYGIGTIDPMLYAKIGGTLIVVTALACWFPARRAMRTDPVIALRSE
jgi:putative ABC transport system permease protein